MALTRTGKNWLLGLLGVGAAGTGYVIWRRHRAPAHRQLEARHAKGHHKKHGHGNDRGHYGHHHKEHDHGE